MTRKKKYHCDYFWWKFFADAFDLSYKKNMKKSFFLLCFFLAFLLFYAKSRFLVCDHYRHKFIRANSFCKNIPFPHKLYVF